MVGRQRSGTNLRPQWTSPCSLETNAKDELFQLCSFTCRKGQQAGCLWSCEFTGCFSRALGIWKTESACAQAPTHTHGPSMPNPRKGWATPLTTDGSSGSSARQRETREGLPQPREENSVLRTLRFCFLPAVASGDPLNIADAVSLSKENRAIIS